MHGMSGAVGYDASDNLPAQQRQIADQVERFVPDKLIGKTQRAVLHSVFRDHDDVLFRSAANQSQVLHGFGLVQKSEGPGRRELPAIKIAGKIDLERLLADGRREADLVAHRVSIRRIRADKFVAVPHLDLADDLQIRPLPALHSESGGGDHVNEGLRASVENRKLKVIELHNRVVESDADKGREQMFGGGNQHAFFLQAGGVADFGDVASDGFDFKIVKVDPPEDNACSRSGRTNLHRHRSTAMQSNASALNWSANCLFVWQVIITKQITPGSETLGVVFLTQSVAGREPAIEQNQNQKP